MARRWWLATVVLALAACSGGSIPADELVSAVESLTPPPALAQWSELERDVLEAGPAGRCAADSPCPRATVRYATVVEAQGSRQALVDLLRSGDLSVVSSEECDRRANVAPSASLPLCTQVGERGDLRVEVELHTAASMGERFGWNADDPRKIVTVTAFAS